MSSNKKINFNINTEKCIKCSKCTNECIFSAITMKGFPVMENPDLCIKCEHCVAICENDAVSLFDEMSETAIEVNNIKADYEELKNLIISRRSMRKFKNKNIDKEIIKDLCNTALYAPTARNQRAINLTIIDEKEILEKFKNKFYEKLLTVDFAKNPKHKVFNAISELYKSGKDVVFANAPHIVIASANPESSIEVEANSMITLSYFELLANSKNIGALWNGILTALIKDFLPEFQKELGIPESHEIGYIMTFGLPALDYKKGIDKGTENKVHLLSEK